MKVGVGLDGPGAVPSDGEAMGGALSGGDRRIGVIVPFDFALDREYWAYVPANVSLHITRTAFHSGPVGVDLARAVAHPAEAAEAVRTLVAIAPDVIAYACTSGSFVNGMAGERALREAMQGAGAATSVTTSGGLLTALAALGARRVALGTPYVSELGALLADFVTDAGMAVVSLANLDLEGGIAELGDTEVERLAAAAFSPDADALFLSCTNLPTFGLLPRLEERYGIPVLSANQVTMWAAVRAAGIDEQLAEGGVRSLLPGVEAPRPPSHRSARSCVGGRCWAVNTGCALASPIRPGWNLQLLMASVRPPRFPSSAAG